MFSHASRSYQFGLRYVKHRRGSKGHADLFTGIGICFVLILAVHRKPDIADSLLTLDYHPASRFPLIESSDLGKWSTGLQVETVGA